MLKRKIYALCVLFLIFFISTASFAEDSLSITRWKVESSLVENGDLMVSEDITFDFKDKFNGVYRHIVLNGTDGIEGIEVYEMTEGVPLPYALVTSSQAEKGSKGLFAATEKDNSMEIKIFSPSKNETKTFRIKYLVKNVATKHLDTGELYYKFLGSENETPINYFTASIALPNKSKEETKIFAHGPLNGEINFIEEDLIKLEVSDVPRDTFIEARILFPNEFIGRSTKNGTKTLQSIVDEELSFIKEIEVRAEKATKNKSLFNNISLMVSGFAIAIVGFVFNKHRRRIDIFETLNSTYPEDITPAELRAFMTSVIDSRALMTTVFDLARKGYVEIQEIEGSKKKKDFSFTRTSSLKDGLLSHEEYFLDWLFNTLGDGVQVTTKDIEYYRKKNLSQFSKDFGIWQKLVKENLKSRDYYDNNMGKYGGMTLGIAFIAFSIGIIGLIFEGFYGIIAIMIGIFAFIYGIVLFLRKSDKGYIQYELWKDFKKDLEKQGKIPENYEVKIPNDKTLIYALALGLPMKSMDSIRLRSEYNTPAHWSYWYFLTNKRGGSSFEDRFNSSFYGNSATTSSSSVGGGGGFSSGGGGGAGGGGAGGF